jgi:hypothetical protein
VCSNVCAGAEGRLQGLLKLIFESCGSRERSDDINESVKALTAAGLNAVGLVLFMLIIGAKVRNFE